MYIHSNKRKQQALDTRNRIFDTAYAMFRERGFYNVTVEEIASAANISVGTLYHHFKNKYAILTAWHDRLDSDYAEYYDEIKDDPRFSTGGAPAVIRELFMHIQETCINNGAEYICVVYSYMFQDDEFAAEMTDPVRSYFRIMKELMEKGQAEGTIRSDVSPLQLAHDITIISRGCFMDWTIRRSNVGMREYCSSVIDNFLRGIRAQQQRP